MTATRDDQAVDIDRCPADGRSRWNHEPVSEISHLSLDHDNVLANLVSGLCPGCGHTLVSLGLTAVGFNGEHREHACWIDLDEVQADTCP
jgi:hypothetical protein